MGPQSVYLSVCLSLSKSSLGSMAVCTRRPSAMNFNEFLAKPKKISMACLTLVLEGLFTADSSSSALNECFGAAGTLFLRSLGSRSHAPIRKVKQSGYRAPSFGPLKCQGFGLGSRKGRQVYTEPSCPAISRSELRPRSSKGTRPNRTFLSCYMLHWGQPGLATSGVKGTQI